MRALLLLMVLAGLAAASPASAQGGQILAGTTVIEADASAMTRVTIPRDARFRLILGDSPDVAFAGGGRFAGVVLRRTAAPLDDVELVVAWQDEPCTPARCDERTLDMGLPTSPDGHLVLPAGEYELAVISDAGPVSVTLRFGGLDGTTTIKPEAPAASSVAVRGQTGSFLVNDFSSQAVTVGAPYGLEIFEYTLRGVPPGAVAYETCLDEFCSRGADQYAEESVDDGPFGLVFSGPLTYTHTFRAAGLLASPWNVTQTIATVTLGAGADKAQNARTPGPVKHSMLAASGEVLSP